MLFSQVYAPTLRETPAEAEIPSHQLMLRAGMMRKAAGGVYTYLPLAYRVLKKIENIVREEMDRKGGQEVLMPIMQPAELWQETGRWDVYGEEMFRLKDRHGRPFCLGPTHEEMITSLVRLDVRSYRQLPLRLYQIQNKYRDEIRPRFGLMRGREFIMKDLYSFDRNEAGLDESYWKMYEAYENIFSRCGLKFRPVEADSGQIGGSGSHEFMVLADSGEAAIAFCSSCDYAANVEKAPLAPIVMDDEEPLALEKVATPQCKSIEEVCQYLKIEPARTIKTLVFTSEKGPIVALIRGDHEVNEVKLQNAAAVIELNLADEKMICEDLASVPGFIGPVGLDKAPLYVDPTVMNLTNAVCGANLKDTHLIHVNPKRDFKPTEIVDLRLIQQGDPCPKCGHPVETARGIEVGQVFKLYTKYSEALGATFLDENGKEKPMVMGCYGVGVSRTMAAAIEQNFDEQGIIWPVAIAPFHVVIVPVNRKNEEQFKAAEEIYQTLTNNGLEVVLDDRNERPGVKFKDADLIGYPLRVTIGPKTIAEGKVEVKVRKTGEQFLFDLADYAEKINSLLQSL